MQLKHATPDSRRPRFLHHLLSWREQGKLPIIAEIKMRSPKAGDLIGNRKVEEILAQYLRGGAACISVVTGRWFGGDLDLFRKVRGLTDAPILRKDFIVSLRDLDVSLSLGADAVLLTRRLLRPDMLSGLAARALEMGMVPFVEAGDRQELLTTSVPAGAVLAINNRDIRLREVDDGTYRNSLDMAAAASRGAGALVSASGIASPRQVVELVEAGFDGALVATALLRSPDIAGFFAETRAGLHALATTTIHGG